MMLTAIYHEKKKYKYQMKKHNSFPIFIYLLIYCVLVTYYVIIEISNLMKNKMNEEISMSTSSYELLCLNRESICLFDDVGIFLGSKGMIHELPSVPSSRRLPLDKISNSTYMIKERERLPLNGSKTPLCDYNLMIFSLYKNDENKIYSELDETLLNRITGKSNPSFSKEEADEVKYIGVYRISNHHSCHIEGEGSHLRGNKVRLLGLLGLALLNAELKIIEGTDMIVDLNHFYFPNEHVLWTPSFHDFQLIATSTDKESKLKNQLFFLATGTGLGMSIIPVDIQRIRDGSISDLPIRMNGTIVPSLYGSGGLQLQALNKKGIHSPRSFFWYKAGIELAKNMHVFQSSNGTYFIEIWPLFPHETRPINFNVIGFYIHTYQDINLFPNMKMKLESGLYPPSKELIVTNATTEPEPSFRYQYFRNESRSRDRGSACCIDMNIEGVQVKVGISHVVSDVWGRVYFSRFYAFESEPPFNIVAKSGLFCLSHALPNDIGLETVAAAQRDAHSNFTSSFDVFKHKYKCPKISFISGMIEMVGNPNMVIISYGVNDCYSRIIFVPKKKIKMVLLGSSY